MHVTAFLLITIFLFAAPAFADQTAQAHRAIIEKYGLRGFELQKYFEQAEQNQMKPSTAPVVDEYTVPETDVTHLKANKVNLKTKPTKDYCSFDGGIYLSGKKTSYFFAVGTEHLRVEKTECGSAFIDKDARQLPEGDCSVTNIKLYKNDRLLVQFNSADNFFIYKNDFIVEKNECGTLGQSYDRYDWHTEKFLGKDMLHYSLDDAPLAKDSCLSDYQIEGKSALEVLRKNSSLSTKEKLGAAKDDENCLRMQKNKPVRLETCEDEIILENGMNVLTYRQKYDAADVDNAEIQQNENCHKSKRGQ